jgi:hypothetical protein
VDDTESWPKEEFDNAIGILSAKWEKLAAYLFDFYINLPNCNSDHLYNILMWLLWNLIAVLKFRIP